MEIFLLKLMPLCCGLVDNMLDWYIFESYNKTKLHSRELHDVEGSGIRVGFIIMSSISYF